jgi:hypothetical protein
MLAKEGSIGEKREVGRGEDDAGDEILGERDALVGHPLGDATRSCKILVLIDKTFLVSDSLSTTSSHRLSSIPANTR